MEQNFYNTVETFVFNSFRNVQKEYEIKHFVRTVFWIKQIHPNVDEAMLVSAISHDIERAFRMEDMLILKKEFGYADINFYRRHEERGAEIISEFLKKNGAKMQFIRKVHLLILTHEEGGNEEQNALKNADSISFLENNAEDLIERKTELVGRQKIRNKIDWMYTRISCDYAKSIATPYFEKAIDTLNKKHELLLL